MVGQQFRANADHYWGDGAEFLVEQFAFHPFSQLGGMAQAVRVFGSETRMTSLVTSLNERMFGYGSDDKARESRGKSSGGAGPFVASRQ